VRTEAGALVDQEPARHDSPGTAFESFFRANYGTVLRIARGVVGDAHLAQDVAQEVFIAAQRRFPDAGAGAGGSDHAANWLRIAAVHTGLNSVRGSRRRERRQLRAGSLATAGAAPFGPEDLVMDEVGRQEVRDALSRLPRRSATVLVLRHSGLSYAEVAEAMGVGTGQVGTMLRRAEASLRKEIEGGARQ
jgi:RNA polymerase sigma factor (sigma-70 family)